MGARDSRPSLKNKGRSKGTDGLKQIEVNGEVGGIVRKGELDFVHTYRFRFCLGECFSVINIDSYAVHTAG